LKYHKKFIWQDLEKDKISCGMDISKEFSNHAA
jgi:hypothetical protein